MAAENCTRATMSHRITITDFTKDILKWYHRIHNMDNSDSSLTHQSLNTTETDGFVLESRNV